jgi:hypothetical protein
MNLMKREDAAGLTDRRTTTLVYLDGMAAIPGTAVIGASSSLPPLPAKVS